MNERGARTAGMAEPGKGGVGLADSGGRRGGMAGPGERTAGVADRGERTVRTVERSKRTAEETGGLADTAITGWALHLPSGLSGGQDKSDLPPERVHEILGRKGLLHKEPATRLALCAVHRALGLPAGASRNLGPPQPRTAVVASSNLGNVATVARLARTVAAGDLRGVSVLDAPNASSNVLASAVAIWFRCGGPNVMVCSGVTSGLDAVATGRFLINAGRADRVIVVGAEPDDEIAAALYRRAVAPDQVLLRSAAGCVVLERADRVTWPAPVIGTMHAGPPPTQPPPDDFDATFGACGVLRTAAAAASVLEHDHAVTVACGSRADGWKWLRVTPTEQGGATSE